MNTKKSRPENVIKHSKSRPENVMNATKSRPENVMEVIGYIYINSDNFHLTHHYLLYSVVAGLMNIEAHILTASTRSMNTSELMAPISMYLCTSIFTPMNTSNTLTPTFR